MPTDLSDTDTVAAASPAAPTTLQLPSLAAPARRVNVLELMHEISQTHLLHPENRHVFLILQLHRSDRVQALSQSETSRLVHTEVSRRFKKVLRTGDFYSFVSTDEVWVLLANLPSEALAKMAARTLRENLARPIQVEAGNAQSLQVHLRPVVGGSWVEQGDFVDALGLASDAADNVALARGLEEHVVVQKAKSGSSALERNVLERDLRLALQGNELEVYYQPQLHISTRECVSAEALIRWRRHGEFVSAALIASICEERA